MKIIKRIKNKKHHCCRCLEIPKFLYSLNGSESLVCKPCAVKVIEECG